MQISSTGVDYLQSTFTKKNNIVASRFFARTPSRIRQIVKICDVVGEGRIFFSKASLALRSQEVTTGQFRVKTSIFIQMERHEFMMELGIQV